jgi:Uma2 family endonuclease
MSVAATTKVWTLGELHTLPDDGNKYELVHGELFVTPAPSVLHETVAARLSERLTPYVAAQGLGLVHHPRAVIRFAESEVEPDLMVRPHQRDRNTDWADAPIPLLVVEILSDSTGRRDRNQKREFYIEIGVPEYWIVDPERSVITVIRPGQPDRACADRLQWEPVGAGEPLLLEVAALFA